MITSEMLCLDLQSLSPEDLQRWIENAWVLPDRESDRYLFDDFDVARVRLIVELRDVMGVNEEALPVVLLLLDQLYAARRQARRLAEAVEQTVPDDLRRDLLQRLMG